MFTKLFINAIAFYITAYLVHGFRINGWQSLFVISVVWGILTSIIKPILVILTLPINILTLGLFTFVINASLLIFMSRIIPGFSIANFNTALISAIVLSLLNLFLSQS